MSKDVSIPPPPDPKFSELISFLACIPSIGRQYIAAGSWPNGWWVKFRIDITHPLAWATVQELGHVLNYLSLNEKLPTIFKPVSPPPYLNGGPLDFLSWVIECPNTMHPMAVVMRLQDSLPNPVEDYDQWANRGD